MTANLSLSLRLKSSSATSSRSRRVSSNTCETSSLFPVAHLLHVHLGDVIPADLRLVDASNFETDEALLTGESLPVAKDVNATWKSKEGGFDPRDVGVGDRINMAYTSSTVTKGRATGIVTSIGMRTEIGAIAESLRGGDSKVRKVRRAHERVGTAVTESRSHRSARTTTVTHPGTGTPPPGLSLSGTLSVPSWAPTSERLFNVLCLGSPLRCSVSPASLPWSA